MPKTAFIGLKTIVNWLLILYNVTLIIINIISNVCCEILLQFKITVFNAINSCDVKLNFQHHYSCLQCLICWIDAQRAPLWLGGGGSYYYQCWKQLCCLIFLWKAWNTFIPDFGGISRFSLFDQLNACLLNKSTNFFQKEKNLTDPKTLNCAVQIKLLKLKTHIWHNTKTFHHSTVCGP